MKLWLQLRGKRCRAVWHGTQCDRRRDHDGRCFSTRRYPLLTEQQSWVTGEVGTGWKP